MAETDQRPGGVPGGVQELGHLVLYVRDLERSVRFYRDVLGWRQVVRATVCRSRRRCSRVAERITSCS
jgi:predicted enzyme related to lactoylglutathione lyase